MKKLNGVISVLFIFACSNVVRAQQKPSQRSMTEEINKVNQKKSLRYKMTVQNQKQIVQGDLNVQKTPVQQPKSEKQGNQQNPVMKASDKPMEVPKHSLKQQ